jgi:hypothetical protein
MKKEERNPANDELLLAVHLRDLVLGHLASGVSDRPGGEVMGEPKLRRRTLLVDVTMPTGRWSSTEMTEWLETLLPEGYEPLCLGSVSAAEVEGAWKKLRRLSRETENDAPIGDRIHSAHKAMSFFRDLWPRSFWQLVNRPVDQEEK